MYFRDFVAGGPEPNESLNWVSDRNTDKLAAESEATFAHWNRGPRAQHAALREPEHS
jgi:hypothetical protein